MGNLWEIYGNRWESEEIYWKIYGNLWESMIYGFLSDLDIFRGKISSLRKKFEDHGVFQSGKRGIEIISKSSARALWDLWLELAISFVKNSSIFRVHKLILMLFEAVQKWKYKLTIMGIQWRYMEYTLCSLMCSCG